ncbi:hypothetical protein HYH03_004646 [Edaphochlamys debaryana]|uniref:Lactation elevated 1 n=1 Tax=Edaphochlamys debaryana TaxID=47281 RepID=A0A835YH29_9CHLO|nr:hypothetical protein HYH03_004646 [Edaphochlamys debaryana]|eukprot:KAG2497494.1 hypothetical protein HYH03_004646 [Edaphochlamys debaryana]
MRRLAGQLWPGARLYPRHAILAAPQLHGVMSTSAAASTPSPSSLGASISSAHKYPKEAAANPVVERYQRMLRDGGLEQDPGQWALVQRLATLYDELLSYRRAMDEHHRELQEYRTRRLHRLQQLLEEEARREAEARQAEARAGGAGQPDGPGSSAATATAGGGRSGSLGSWLRSAATALVPSTASWLGGSQGGTGGAGDTPAARARRAALAREERLTAELGPPPAAPEPPRGLYVWGSVGSGKSMLVSLFYQALTESGALTASRWVHFNAAMLEVHSRLHHLDTQRWAARAAREAQHAQQLEAARQGQRGGGQEAAGQGDESDDEDEAGSASPAAGWSAASDPEVARQREARAAMLAVRRHMRLARQGRNDARGLGASNAEGLVRVAASLVRGRNGDPLSGWEAGEQGAGPGGRQGGAPSAALLAFDEVQVTDVFNAVALKGLVEALTASGCVLLATSNRHPSALPRAGLHEAMWGHFVDTLMQRCEVVELSSPTDYRRLLLEQGRASLQQAAAKAAAAEAGGAGAAGVARAARPAGPELWPPLSGSYLSPAGPGAAAEMEELWAAATEGRGQGAVAGRGVQPPLSIPVLFGRTLEVPRVSPCGGAAWFSFPELCDRRLGPADYVALAQRFHTVFLEGVPVMDLQVRDQARRFITLVDELYNARCLLVASAQAPPEDLFTGSGSEPILAPEELEGLQFETAVEDGRLRRNAMAQGGVAPVAAGPAAQAAAADTLGGGEERFAFRRAVSRLMEMQSARYMLEALRLRQGLGLGG